MPHESAGNDRVPRNKLEAAMADVASHRKQYLRQLQRRGDADSGLLRDWHASILNFYLELRPYRDTDALGQKWQEARLWPQDDVQRPRDHADDDWVTGVDTLYDWVNNRTREVERDLPGRGRGTETVEVPTHLPAERLLRITDILNEIARDLGVAIETKSGRRPTSRIGNDDLWTATDGGESE